MTDFPRSLLFSRASRATPNKENGGSPEDARQEVKSMNVVRKVVPQVKTAEDVAKAWVDEKVALSRHGIIVERIELDPTIAKVLLENNPANRRISPQAVESYARDMSNGAWADNGEPIIISNDGMLNDGQHRCEAVVLSGVSIPATVVIGPTRESRLTVDQGKMRLISDYLSMEGHVDGAALGAAANYAWQHLNHGCISLSSHMRPTKSEIFAFVESHPDIKNSLKAFPSKGSDGVGGRAMLAFCHWTFKNASGAVTDADLFISCLISGSNLVPRSPILYARNRLMQGRGRLKPSEKAEIIFRAWNASRRGEKVASLPIKGGALPKVER